MKNITVRALRSIQGENIAIFSFFIPAKDLINIADISRLTNDINGEIKGFQRPEIKDHIKGIIDYLDLGNILFPNSILLALSPQIKFSASRGSKNKEDLGISQSGTLTLPIFPKGERIAWIVDGQQRTIALSKTKNQNLPIPVIGFISNNLQLQREQFILVNKIKALPSRLINELLPETRSIILPKELHTRKLPAEICNLLNSDPDSPFFQLIKRASNSNNSRAYITDTSVINMIRNSISNPLGALASLKEKDGTISKIEEMYHILSSYWQATRETFPEAWQKDPRHSRLTHSVGILSMGVLMDQIYSRNYGSQNFFEMFKFELSKIANSCAWTNGEWKGLNLPWNQLQNTPKDIKRLQDFLIHLYNQSSS